MPFNFKNKFLKSIPGFVDLQQLSLDLTEIQRAYPELFDAHVLPALEDLKRRYGTVFPTYEIQELFKLADSLEVQSDAQRLELVNRELHQSPTVQISAIRLSVLAAKAAYRGPEPGLVFQGVDQLLESLASKYGDRVPIEYEHAISKYVARKLRGPS